MFELSDISATETELGLCLYYRELGELPAKLDQLVPAYLPAVPLDYFDRHPIRYSRDNFAVWSVGPNHFNVTSPSPDFRETRGELYYRLDFAAPPRPVPLPEHAEEPEASPAKPE